MLDTVGRPEVKSDNSRTSLLRTKSITLKIFGKLGEIFIILYYVFLQDLKSMYKLTLRDEGLGSDKD